MKSEKQLLEAKSLFSSIFENMQRCGQCYVAQHQTVRQDIKKIFQDVHWNVL